MENNKKKQKRKRSELAREWSGATLSSSSKIGGDCVLEKRACSRARAVRTSLDTVNAFRSTQWSVVFTLMSHEWRWKDANEKKFNF